MTRTPPPLRTLLPFALLAACGSNPVVGPADVAADRPDDLAPTDAPTDAPADVAPVDAQPADVADVALDVAMDAAPDVAVDAADDAEPDGASIDFLPPEDVVDAGDVPRDFTLLDIPITTPVLPRPGRSGAVAVSADDRIAVTANRGAGTVSVYALATGVAPALVREAEVSVGAGSEPWQVTLSPDGDTAYVLLRRAQQVVRITRVRSRTPMVSAARAATGSEPTSMALTPSGRALYVANWGDGTVTTVDTAAMTVTGTLDLNLTLSLQGTLGTRVPARRGLAHPRAIVLTNDGDQEDVDETLFVTEFFAVRRETGTPAGLERFDQDRVGLVYRMPLASRAVTLHTFGPAADMGFRAGDNTVAGCFPNQLYAATIAQNRLFVTAVCESPRGPVGPVAPPPPADAGPDAAVDAAVDAPVDRPDVADTAVDVADAGDVPDALPPIPPLDPAGANFRTQVTGAVFVLDVASGNEVVAGRALLTQRFYALYDTRRTPDDAQRRMPLIPVDIDFVPGANNSTAASTVAYVAAYGSDALFRVTFTAAGAFASVGAATGNAFVDLGDVSAPVAPGAGPYGVATAATVNNAFVVNEFTRNVSAVDLATQTVTATADISATAPTAPVAQQLRGRRFFATGLGRWSFKGQAWNSCEACHPDGLTDNVTWFFARGPRQTVSLDHSLDASGAPRIMNWTAVFDELADFELNIRGNSGGVGAIVHRRGDGAMPPSVTNADRIVFDGTAPVAPQLATAEPNDGLSGAVDSVATPAGTNRVRSVLDEWADVRAWVASLRTPRAPTGLDMADVTAGRALFVTHNCAGCHGGPQWSNTARFYTPGGAVTERVMGSLVRTSWTRPMNFPTAVLPAMGTFRPAPFDAANDQITCVLRNVGTWAMNTGVAPAGVNVLEVRANMTAASQGATGFAPPSLLGVVHGAPYLHAGNARSLEELLGPTFVAHHRAFSPNFLAGANADVERRQMVAFLSSIDGDTAPVPAPARVTLPGTMTAFDANPCAQFR